MWCGTAIPVFVLHEPRHHLTIRPPLLLFLSSRSIEPRHCHPSSSYSSSCFTQNSSAIDEGAINIIVIEVADISLASSHANKRRRTEGLLDYIENDDFQTYSSSPIFSSIISDDIPTLRIPSTSLAIALKCIVKVVRILDVTHRLG